MLKNEHRGVHSIFAYCSRCSPLVGLYKWTCKTLCGSNKIKIDACRLTPTSTAEFSLLDRVAFVYLLPYARADSFSGEPKRYPCARWRARSRQGSWLVHPCQHKNGPTITFMSETHLASVHHPSVRRLWSLDSNTDLFLSSKRPTNNQHCRPSTALPGGVGIALSPELSKHPSTTLHKVQRAVEGYICHVSIPFQPSSTLHLLSVYCPPNETIIRDTVLSYATSCCASAATKGEQVMVAGDFNTNILKP